MYVAYSMWRFRHQHRTEPWRLQNRWRSALFCLAAHPCLFYIYPLCIDASPSVRLIAAPFSTKPVEQHLEPIAVIALLIAAVCVKQGKWMDAFFFSLENST